RSSAPRSTANAPLAPPESLRTWFRGGVSSDAPSPRGTAMRHPCLPALVAGLCLLASGCATTPAAAPETAAPSAATLDVFELGIADLQARMAHGDVSSEALVQAYLARIAAIDDAGPRLNAVIETNPLALQEARARDADRRAGVVHGPMHGIPVLLKD